MPNSRSESGPSYEDVSTYLRAALPESTISSVDLARGYKPLLILETNRLVAAFAFADEEVRVAYDALYVAFKQSFSTHRSDWQSREAAFVLLVPATVSDLEQLCSSIETDVYFCRKFVLPHGRSVEETLCRLPFLPLDRLHGQLIRPPSAQTFLQQCGVPSKLARYLVVQSERSAEGIHHDSLRGAFGEPHAIGSELVQSSPSVVTTKTPVRLDSVTIQNFRAYRAPQTFDIGLNITVLYGPNGFGKTSFFDAIDFAVTGDIGRIRSAGEEHFARTAKHLDSPLSESKVSICFSETDLIHTLSREVGDRRNAILNGLTTDRKSVLSVLTGSNIPPTDRIENFVSLFRATHLFSQEHQELVRDFHIHSTLSEEIVARMLAFQDYTNAVTKCARVRELFRDALERTEDEMAAVSNRTSVDRDELNRLKGMSKQSAPTKSLTSELRLFGKRVAQFGIEVDTAKTDVAAVRGWRATLIVRLAEIEHRIAWITNLSKDVAELPRTLLAQEGIRKQIAALEKSLDATAARFQRAQLAITEREQQFSGFQVQRDLVQKRVDALSWASEARNRVAILEELQRTLSKEVDLLVNRSSSLRVNESRASSEIAHLEKLRMQLERKINSISSRIQLLQTVRNESATWVNHAAQLRELESKLETCSRKLAQLQDREKQFVSEGQGLSERDEALLREVAYADRAKSEFERLAAGLLSYADDGRCPLCGVDHGSLRELKVSVSRRGLRDFASGSRSSLEANRKRSAEISKELENIRRERKRIGQSITGLNTLRNRLKDGVKKFAENARTLRIGDTESLATVQADIQSRWEREQHDLTISRAELDEIDRRLETLKADVAIRTRNLATTVADLESKQQHLNRVSGNIQTLRKDPRTREYPLETTPAEFQTLLAAASEDLSRILSRSKSCGDLLAKAREDHALLSTNSSVQVEQLNVLRKQLSASEEAAARVQNECERLGLSISDTEQLRAELQDNVQTRELITELIAFTDTLELALDSLTTAASVRSLRDQVRMGEESLKNLRQVRIRQSRWLEYFGNIADALSEEQNGVVARFTKQYGPRTSVMQRRLRSAYGFEDIEIRNQDSAIQVLVRRRGEDLRPTDYFSQSQQQTLLLGLFLTACLSQTWSALSPIFLDDPVTHFDDLNTYAFLDLILGLLESEVGSRQFVISTCDERLFQLARQKFRHLAERALFYVFSGISDKGPIVQKAQ